MLHRTVLPTVALLAGLALSACGTTTSERATTGGALGAATGAGVAALTEADMLGAGLIGAAAGAAAGALTEPSTVNLGEPVWN